MDWRQVTQDWLTGLGGATGLCRISLGQSIAYTGLGIFVAIAPPYPLVSPVGSASACSSLSPLLCLNMCL